jgi:hypothetical protein
MTAPRMGNPFAYIHCSLAQQNIFATLRYFAERGFGLLDFLIKTKTKLLPTKTMSLCLCINPNCIRITRIKGCTG